MLDFIVSISILMYVFSLIIGATTLLIMRIYMVQTLETKWHYKVFYVLMPLSVGVFISPLKNHPMIGHYEKVSIISICLQLLGSFYIIYTYVA